MTASDDNNNELYSASGSFKTLGETGTTTYLDQIPSDQVQCTKALRDGQLVIIRDGAMYNAEGKRIQ
jgi:hypothetical protein